MRVDKRSDCVLCAVKALRDGGDDVLGHRQISAVEDVAHVLSGHGADIVAAGKGHVVVVGRAAAAGRYLDENIWL